MAVPLLLFPRVLSLIFGTLLAEMGDPETHEKPGADVLRTLNILERSLAGLAGLSCFALAALLLVQVSEALFIVHLVTAHASFIPTQSGTIPFTGSLTDSRDLASSPAAAPYRSPSIWIAAAFFGGLAYTTYNIGLVFLAAPSVGLCAWGLWVVRPVVRHPSHMRLLTPFPVHLFLFSSLCSNLTRFGISASDGLVSRHSAPQPAALLRARRPR